MSIIEGTVDLTKNFGRPVDAVFAAWSREEAQRAWSDPGEGWELSFEQFQFAVGETDVCRFGPVGGQDQINENRYLEIEHGKRIVYSTSLSSDGRLTFAGTVAVTFEETDRSTRMRLVEQGLYFDGQDDVKGHRSGWESMLGAPWANTYRAGGHECVSRRLSPRLLFLARLPHRPRLDGCVAHFRFRWRFECHLAECGCFRAGFGTFR